LINQDYFDDLSIETPVHLEHSNSCDELFVYPMHWHLYMEIIYMIRGKLAVSVGQRETVLEGGDMAVFVSRELHSVHSLPNGPMEYCLIQFDPMVLFGAQQDTEEFREIYPQLFTHGHRCIYVVSDLTGTPVPSLVHRMREERGARRYGYKLAMRAHLLELCLWLFRRWNEENPLSASGSFNRHELMRTVFEHVHKHYGEPITTAQMAALVSTSIPHFCRTFKRFTGNSFGNYLRYVRTIEAQKLLQTTDHAIAQIASMVGYADVNFFIRSFKQSIGVPPLRYRRLENEKMAILQNHFN